MRHRRRIPRPGRARVTQAEPEEGGTVVGLRDQRLEHTETSPRLTGGDVDADWQGAAATGEEAVGGSVATPDQDVVDEIGRALGVEREDEAELTTSTEILEARDRRRWELEAAAEGEEGV